MSLLDAYDRRARVAPGLLAATPVALVALGLGIGDSPLATTIVSLLTACGGTIVIALVVRKRGRTAQARLWAEWGAPPIEAALLEDTRTAADRRQRIEQILGFTISSDQEPAERFRTVKALFRLTQDKSEHPLVFEENWRYGFIRNLYGIRRSGRLISAVSTAVLIGLLGLNIAGVVPEGHDLSTTALVLTLAPSLLLAWMWVVVPTTEHVRSANERLGERLLETIDAQTLQKR